MNYERFDIIEFDGGSYIILNVVTYKNSTYLYLINNDENKDDVSVVKVIVNNDVAEYVPIDNDEEFEYVIGRLLLDNKEIITDVMSSNNDDKDEN